MLIGLELVGRFYIFFINFFTLLQRASVLNTNYAVQCPMQLLVTPSYNFFMRVSDNRFNAWASVKYETRKCDESSRGILQKQVRK